jgi:hypothetical protein
MRMMGQRMRTWTKRPIHRRTDIAVIKNPGEPTKVVLEYNTWKRLANIFYEADKAQNKQKKQGGATSATSQKGDKGRGV